MNTLDVLKWGQNTVRTTLAAFPVEQVDTAGACGWWSVRQITAHLTSFEQILVDVLTGLVEGGPTPTLDEFLAGHMRFNDNQVARRDAMSMQQVLDELNDAHGRALALARRVPVELFARNGVLAWYGAEYDLDDFLVYTFYGHKREHCAQVNAFKDVLERQSGR